ncbi:MAG: hypothetical protein RBS07_17510 [Lentimicrobium sp.]|jgi:hypothetical protein|nr:hypothetical protein [Lentimicrobium sp.]
MNQPDLAIISDSVLSIQASFDPIAEDLITNWNLKVNDELFSFTELEFYFFKYNVHEENTTHDHDHEKGEWRFHRQGLDITFSATESSDGGNLLRGIKSGNEFINDPIRVLEAIFRKMNPVSEIQNQFGLVPAEKKQDINIYKTFRHGLSKPQDIEFKDASYRYYTDIEQWKKNMWAQLKRIESEVKV